MNIHNLILRISCINQGYLKFFNEKLKLIYSSYHIFFDLVRIFLSVGEHFLLLQSLKFYNYLLQNIYFLPLNARIIVVHFLGQKFVFLKKDSPQIYQMVCPYKEGMDSVRKCAIDIRHELLILEHHNL